MVLGWRASFPFPNSKIGKRDGAVKETTKEPSKNLTPDRSDFWEFQY